MAAGKGTEEINQCHTPVSGAPQGHSIDLIPEPQLGHGTVLHNIHCFRASVSLPQGWIFLHCSKNDKQGAHCPSQAAKDTQINTDKHGLLHYCTHRPLYFRLAAEFRAVAGWGVTL